MSESDTRKKPNGIIKTVVIAVLVTSILGLWTWTLATAQANSTALSSLQTWKEEGDRFTADEGAAIETRISNIELVIAAEETPEWFDRWFKAEWEALVTDVKEIGDKTDLIREEQIKVITRLDSIDKND